LGIPLPASTQWDIVHALAKRIRPAYRELIRQAADGEVPYNDDTTIKILELMGKHACQQAVAEEPSGDSGETEQSSLRSGLFTSGIVSTREGRRIALFFSGRKHAGENLKEVLLQRAQELGSPIQMCDALSRNLPGELKTILAHCLAHGRRRFVDVAEHFPDQCRHVLESLAVIYRNDALTLFLRQPGAPLDNNLCERALKKAILHRKNALFYRTAHGARVGDLLMSLIYTCQLNRTNPFDYLTELQRHEGELPSHPQNWMPWNYRQTVVGSTSPSAVTS
jgi:hypothetical protein